MNPNLAGILVLFAVAAPALLRWRRTRDRGVTPGKGSPAFPLFGLGVALFLAVAAATGVAAFVMRSQETPVRTIRVPDASPAGIRDTEQRPAPNRLLTAMLVREQDNRVMQVWEKETSGSSDILRIQIPYTEIPGEITLRADTRTIFVTHPGKYREESESEVVRALGSGRAYIPEINLNDTRARKSNLFALLTPGADYHLLCFATPLGVFPMKSVDAQSVVTGMDWLRPLSRAETYDEYQNERSARRSGEGFWKAAPAAEQDMSMRLFQKGEYGAPRSSSFFGVDRWMDPFGPAWLVAFVVTPFFLSWRGGYRPVRFIGAVTGMLLLGVVVERFVAPAHCDAAAYQRFFTSGKTPDSSAR